MMSPQETHSIFTIGHSTHGFPAFLALLKKHGVTAIADVRSSPYSRVNPQYNRETLKESLTAAGIEYVFLGKELGARSDDPSTYDRGRVQYERLRQTDLFRKGIERVVLGRAKFRIALMCAEKEPLDCHRCILCAPALVDMGIPVFHILADGRLEPHENTMRRLLAVVGLPDEDLFRSPGDLIKEALARQESKIAYTDESTKTAAGDAP